MVQGTHHGSPEPKMGFKGGMSQLG